MKILKTDAYPNEKAFLAVVEECREYLLKRSQGGNAPPKTYPRPVVEYVEMLNKHERYDFPLEPLEFIALTEDEYEVKQGGIEQREKETKATETAEERKKQNMLLALQDPQYREVFLRNEVYASGTTLEDLVWNIVLQLSGVKSRQTYFSSIIKKKNQADQALRGFANSSGETYVEE